MTNLFTLLLVLLAAGPAAVLTARAQNPAPSAAYDGPRYPGGPDSLRALAHRSTRQLNTGAGGLAMVQVELKEGSQPINFKIVGSNPAELLMNKGTQATLEYLQTHMLAWQPGAPNPDAKPGHNPRFSIALDFTTPPAAQPYPYADQEPIFPDLAALLRAQHNVYFERNLASPARLADLASASKGLSTYVQMQVRYPAQALRYQQQGVVRVYFEVAASGAIQHTQIIGSASDALDAEVLRVVQQLPAAAVPAKLRGQAVAVYYVLPITFKIQ